MYYSFIYAEKCILKTWVLCAVVYVTFSTEYSWSVLKRNECGVFEMKWYLDMVIPYVNIGFTVWYVISAFKCLRNCFSYLLSKCRDAISQSGEVCHRLEIWSETGAVSWYWLCFIPYLPTCSMIYILSRLLRPLFTLVHMAICTVKRLFIFHNCMYRCMARHNACSPAWSIALAF